ncbi:MAG: tetratricopeptide repeat protein [Candidatus Obscuribacterales bacterium]|nr:tetratricopeptide repeat protein [Candidatus Obscuribacterales bacterium]
MSFSSKIAAVLKAEFAHIDCSKILVFVNVLLFIAMAIVTKGSSILLPPQEVLINWGANLGAFSVDGQYWRFLSSIFIHAGILHLALNMYALWTFGPAVSELYGNKRFLLIYLVSGIAGNLSSTLWNPAQISVGASGALLGLAGAMLATLIASDKGGKRRFAKPLIFFAIICASLLSGFFYPEIDNAAHLGGFAAGLICGLILQKAKTTASPLLKIVYLSCLLLFSTAVFELAVSSARADKRSELYRIASSAMANLRRKEFASALSDYDRLLKIELTASAFVGRGEAYAGLKKYQNAFEDSQRALAMDPNSLSAEFLQSRIKHESGDDSESIQILGRIIRKNPRNAVAYNSRAWSELAIREYKKALHDANRALILQPQMSEALDTRGLVYYLLGDFEKARADYKRALALKPEDGAAYYHLALLSQAEGARIEASRLAGLASSLGYKAECWEPVISFEKKPQSP